MEYELRELENIISNILQPVKQRQTKLTIELITEIRFSLETACERIKQKLVYEAGDYRNPAKKLKQFVLRHQHAIVAMIDLVNLHVAAEKLPVKVLAIKKAYHDLLGEALQATENIYQFLRQKFPLYFDAEAAIPMGIKIKTEEEIKQLIRAIKESFTKAGIDAQLLSIVCEPFQKLLKEGAINYRALYYLQALNSAFKKRNDKSDVLKGLLQLNFNSAGFLNYYIEKMKPGDEREMTTSELIVYYTYEIKIINQVGTNTGVGFNPVMPSIRDQLVSWIAEEIYYLEKKNSILNNSQGLNTTSKEPVYKVQTSLSVSHLSLAVKLLLDTGIIQNKNVTELLKNVARSFRTEKAETISEDSLRNKSYSYEARTVNEMKDVIIGLLNCVRRY